MKNLRFLFYVAIISSTLFSCSTDFVPDNRNYSYIISDTTNYWNRNTLLQLNLKGNIKSVRYYGVVYEFDQKGYLSIITNGHFIYQYNYDSKNRLTTISSNDNEGVTTFKYNNSGKFIPYDPHISYVQIQKHFIEYLPLKFIPILIQNLSSVKTTTQYRKYQFLNDSTLHVFINTAYNIGQDTVRDTAIVKYQGIYPISLLYKSGNENFKFQIDNIKYAANGMFLSYTDCGSLPYQENFSDNKMFWTNYQFLNNNNSLMPRSINCNLFDNYYFYNKYYELEKDSIRAGNVYNIHKYTNYVYDKYFNWIFRKNILNNDKLAVEERIFTYW